MKLPTHILHNGKGESFYLGFGAITLLIVILVGCSDNLLQEEPKDFLNSDVVLINEEGFQSAINSLYMAARAIFFREDGSKMYSLQIGTDVAMTGDRSLNDFENYETWLTPTQTSLQIYWNRLYLEM